MTADRLLTDKELPNFVGSGEIKEDGRRDLIIHIKLTEVLAAQDAKSIAEHNKWIAEQKEAIADILCDAKCAEWDECYGKPLSCGKNKLKLDAIISLLTEAK